MYFGNEAINEAASGSVFFDDGIRIRLDDEFGNTRGQTQSNESKNQGKHGARIKITAPESCKGYTIVIPENKDKDIYVKKGNQDDPKRLPTDVKEVKKFVEDNRENLTDLWNSASDENKQAEIFKKIIDNEDSIRKVTAFSDNKINNEVNKYIKDKRKENNG